MFARHTLKINRIGIPGHRALSANVYNRAPTLDPTDSRVLLNLNQISIRRGRNLLIEKATFQVHAGQRMGLIGANGSGKTSLFAMFLGELEADDGELNIDPHDVIAHVAQESPNTTNSALEYVIDGDKELRETQAAIAAGEARSAGDDAELHASYEKMQTIDGFTADARAASGSFQVAGACV
jgi:ATP-binding cassette subfamily F protein 3